MKKILVLIISLFSFISVNYAVSNVNYKIDDYIVDASIDISGNLKVREIIKSTGSYNGYIRDLVYKNDRLGDFTGDTSSFEGSSIYNPTGIDNIKVGSINYNGELSFDAFNSEVTEFSECTNNRGCYTISDITNGKSIKMYNETVNSSTYFYIEYTLGNTVVLHNDVAELYLSFIGNGFDDDIGRYQLRVTLPQATTNETRVWAHGPLSGEVSRIVDEVEGVTKYYGGYLKIEDLKKNTPVDMRMVFDKSLIMVDHPFLKKSKVEALDKILEVEQVRADDANKQRKTAKILVYGTYALSGTYLLILLLIIVYLYIKYDKERKRSFDMEYNREFIDDYDVTAIEYLYDKKITEKGFSTSILNLIYKKKISFEKLDKKDYKFTRTTVDESELNEGEKKVMDILFNKAGSNNMVTLKDIKKYAKEVNGTTSPFLKGFDTWKSIVTNESEKLNFYENNRSVKLKFSLYALVSILILYLDIKLGMFNLLAFIVIISTIVYIIYLVSFNKRTIRGNLDYNKWKAFERFLKDFGRFDEKELPEIKLWERYLVYANIFGLADKVSKTMKIKFNEMYPNDYTNRDFVFDYYLWSSLNSDINRTVHSSISTAHSEVASKIAESSSSSGSGFGGGFSSGGGFGGGGGGGRGF
jgi:membrane protein-like protein